VSVKPADWLVTWMRAACETRFQDRERSLAVFVARVHGGDVRSAERCEVADDFLDFVGHGRPENHEVPGVRVVFDAGDRGEERRARGAKPRTAKDGADAGVAEVAEEHTRLVRRQAARRSAWQSPPDRSCRRGAGT